MAVLDRVRRTIPPARRRSKILEYARSHLRNVWDISDCIVSYLERAAKLATALLRVAGVTAGLAESNGSLPPGL